MFSSLWPTTTTTTTTTTASNANNLAIAIKNTNWNECQRIMKNRECKNYLELESKQTALHQLFNMSKLDLLASNYILEELVEYLLHQINMRDKNGNTCFHLAIVKQQSSSLILLLLHNKANPYIKNDLNQSVFEVCTNKENLKTLSTYVRRKVLYLNYLQTSNGMENKITSMYLRKIADYLYCSS